MPDGTGSVLDCAFDAIVTMDPAGMIVAMNTAAERMFGYAREHALGRELAALIIPEEDRGKHREALARAPNPSSSSRIVGQRLELDGMRADGTRFPIELSVSRIDSPTGISYTAWIRDLSARRQTEEALRLSEAQLRQAQKMERGRLAGGVAHASKRRTPSSNIRLASTDRSRPTHAVRTSRDQAASSLARPHAPSCLQPQTVISRGGSVHDIITTSNALHSYRPGSRTEYRPVREPLGRQSGPRPIERS